MKKEILGNGYGPSGAIPRYFGGGEDADLTMDAALKTQTKREKTTILSFIVRLNN